MRRTLTALVGLFAAGLACAHPLGNNTVNRQAALHVSSTSVSLRYRVDLAEIPTLLATADADSNGDGVTSASEWAGYARRYGEQIRDGIELQVNHSPLPLRLRTAHWELAPGAAGLSTLRIDAQLSAPLTTQTPLNIDYQDHRHPDEPGWKEVFATYADGIQPETSDVPQASLSQDLTAYPAGEMPNLLAASVTATILPSVAASHREDAGLQPAAHTPVTLTQQLDTPQKEPPPSASTARTRQPPATPLTQLSPPVRLPPWAFFRLGVHHIATGWDHLMFLLGLIVAQPSLRRLAGVVTAFTVAHSLTLGLAASGLVSLPGVWVEPAIALTIAYVGLSNLLGYSRHGAALSFGFGLVHGFGFAGALAESMGSLRIGNSGWLLDLFSFNLGIEAFQLALILAIWPLLYLTTRQTWSGTALKLVSFIVMSAGLGWFFSRI